MRLGVSKDLGFSRRDRSENVRRTAELARLLNDQGLIAIAALVRAERPRAGSEPAGSSAPTGSSRCSSNPPVEVCRARDRAGLYRGRGPGRDPASFPGVSASYDEPDDADSGA